MKIASALADLALIYVVHAWLNFVSKILQGKISTRAQIYMLCERNTN